MKSQFIVQSPAPLLTVLFAQLPEVKRGKVREWLQHGCVQVNGEVVTRQPFDVRAGDHVTVNSHGVVARSTTKFPQGMSLVYEDDHVIVVDKPVRLLSVANDVEREKTVYAYLTDYVQCGNPRSRERVFVIHRLDRETSGLMVFAKTEDDKYRLQESWSEARKRYLAVVEGAPPEEEGEFRSHLDESQVVRVYSGPANDSTRLAVTQYRVVKRVKRRTLVELLLLTGRRNQIRVQLADAGCPICGDQRYGARTDHIGRLALHAHVLGFTHPQTQEWLEFESALPYKLASLVRTYRQAIESDTEDGDGHRVT